MHIEFYPLETWVPIESIEIECNNTREELDQRDLNSQIELVLDTLTPREKYILVQRYFQNKTQDEVAKSLNIHKSRIGPLEHKALRKLRHPLRSDFLLDDNRENIAALKQYKESMPPHKESMPPHIEVVKNKRPPLSNAAKIRLRRRRKELQKQREKERKSWKERQAEEQKRHQENQAYFNREYAKQVARQEYMRKNRAEYEQMLFARAVPYGIYLTVTQNINGDIVYSLVALPGHESVLISTQQHTLDRWIDLLKQRAKWLEENFI